MVSPFLFATLTGAHVFALDRRIAPDVPVEFRRDRTALDDTTNFDSEDMVGRVIAEPLASKIKADPEATYKCIVVLNVTQPQGLQAARTSVERCLKILNQSVGPIDYRTNDKASHPYVFATLTGAQVQALVDLDRNPSTGPISIHQIWEDNEVQSLITKSIATVKADAAQIAYGAAGSGIVWAVLDSGIDVTHPHFKAYGNLSLDDVRPVRHRDFANAMPPASDPSKDDPGAMVDAFGHGTHVAGIMAGTWAAPGVADSASAPSAAAQPSVDRPTVLLTTRNGAGADERAIDYPPVITGMAPKCTLVSMRVLNDSGSGQVSSIIDAFEEIQQLNSYGRRMVIAGVNFSIGYPFDAKWFACGQSPLCVEVNRLVRSGVVVVSAAGNWDTAPSTRRTPMVGARPFRRPSTIRATPISQSPSDRRIGRRPIYTGFRISLRKVRRATAVSNPISSHQENESFLAPRRSPACR